MSAHVLDIGEREEAFATVYTATKRLRETFKYIDRKLDKEEPGFEEFKRAWRVAASLSDKYSPHPGREWFNKFGEHLSSDSVELSSSDEDSTNDDDGKVGESDVDSMDLDERPPAWILNTSAKLPSGSDGDGRCITEHETEKNSSREENSEEQKDMSTLSTDDQNINVGVDWQADSWKSIDLVVVRAVKALPGGLFLSPAALRFLCEQVTMLCLAANRANGKLVQVDKVPSCGGAVPWECTLEMCYAMSSVPISEQTLERVKRRMRRILSDKKQRQEVRERRQLRMMLMLGIRSRSDIPRITEDADKVYQHFGSIKRLLNATEDELGAIPTLGTTALKQLQSWKRTLNAKLAETPATSITSPTESQKNSNNNVHINS
ncbi:hypothetical protein GAYE_SCF22MG4183 [Galdieria yellowstonensis]|uniref:HRDC domain-containing protein n=1 Tax=Galdieria yellowstonensis TaxID=3028027 RepID=A0AAV9IFU3_9RHOD|nr:hypothetical protein GAYE_SCF22MG4183 [Galdieria yellowstonensis]